MGRDRAATDGRGRAPGSPGRRWSPAHGGLILRAEEPPPGRDNPRAERFRRGAAFPMVQARPDPSLLSDACDMTSALFSPIRLADLELANRIVVSPMCQYSADDGVASDWHINHLGMLANSGAALLVIEATGIERRGRITHGCLGLYSDDCEAALARVIAHCRRYGTAKLGIQLAHAGRKASARRPWEGGQPLAPGEDAWQTVAPSAIAFGPDWPVPREMTAADMERVRDGFVDAAKRAIRAGIDAIELHGAHGYLLHSFLSPISNKRSDGYGGSLTARMRYPLEIARAVRAVMPRGMPHARASPATIGSRAD